MNRFYQTAASPSILFHLHRSVTSWICIYPPDWIPVPRLFWNYWNGRDSSGESRLGLSSYVPIEIQLSSVDVRSRVCRGKKQRLPENEKRASVISRDSERGWICPEHSWCIDSISLESFPALFGVKARVSPTRPNIFLRERGKRIPLES